MKEYIRYTLKDVSGKSKNIDYIKEDIKTKHDSSLKQWRMTVCLDTERYWFLSVFFNDKGSFDKFSLDYEAASDSHYEFSDETAVRKLLYKPGDENRYFHRILKDYVTEYGGFKLRELIYPYVTASFHFD